MSVHFPDSFHLRPCDRYLDALLSQQGVRATAAAGLRSKLWFEWAVSKKSERSMKDYGGVDGFVSLVESWIGWEGDPSAFINAAHKSGFLQRENDVITLTDFVEHNQHLMDGYMTMQQKGAAAKRLSGIRGKAVKESSDLFEVSERTGKGLFADSLQVDDAVKKSALSMVVTTARILQQPTPDESAIPPSVIAAAVKLVDSRDEEFINNLLIELLDEVKNGRSARPTLHSVFTKWQSSLS